MPKKSFIGEPYFRSQRKARLYPTEAAAFRALKRKKAKGAVYRIGEYKPKKYRTFVIKEKGKKYYSK